MEGEHYFLYDCMGFVCRTTSKAVLLGCARRVLKGIGIVSWYSTNSPGGTYFTMDDFLNSL